jgi:quercetin dioxygenase-like cupin family protein
MRLYITTLIAFVALMISSSHAAEESRMLQIVPPKATVHKHAQIPVVHWGKGIELRRAWGKHIMMSQTKLSKGVKSPKHNHAEEEIITVVSGKLHVVSGDRNLTVEPGDYLIIPSYVPHQAEAMENTSLIEAFGPGRLFKKEKVEQ